MCKALLISTPEILCVERYVSVASSLFGILDIWYNLENKFSTSNGALVGRPRDTIFAKTATFESQ